ncbi:MAG: cupin domain-containing protein [Candidatus Roizmanbacteria bacterium]|nr:cupin domain-containing protein [Candidatus Roizmanbacteria bacterium]
MNNEQVRARKYSRRWGYALDLSNFQGMNVSIDIIMPGEKIAAHYHKKQTELAVILNGECLVNDQRAERYSVFIWNPGEIHEFVNMGINALELLCVTTPFYDSDDEHYDCLPSQGCSGRDQGLLNR